MSAGATVRLPTRLDDALAHAIGPDAAATVRRALADPAVAADVAVGPHGTVVLHAAPGGGPRRRVLELDRRGAPLAALRWSAEALVTAWVRVPDGSWLVIEPRATVQAPWGLSDRLRQAERVGADGRPLTELEALEWGQIDRIPTLAAPGALPLGGGTAVLNLIAALAVDQRRSALPYRGPYPTEQLFLSLLEAFRYETEAADPLAAFMSGGVLWTPAPHERLLTPEGAWLQLRERVEKVVWRGRAYYRADWPGVARHAPRRVHDAEDGVRCSLWALGAALEEHLVLTPEGTVVRVVEPPPQPDTVRPLPSTVNAGIGTVVAAGSAPPLAPFIRDAAAALALEWGPVAGDLVDVGAEEARLSTLLRRRLVDQLRAAVGPTLRAMLALTALTELALLLGDTLRVRAQARLATLPEPAQRLLLTSPPPASEPGDARVLTDAADALLSDARLDSA